MFAGYGVVIRFVLINCQFTKHLRCATQHFALFNFFEQTILHFFGVSSVGKQGKSPF